VALRDVELDIATLLQAAGLGLSMSANPPTLYAGPFPESAPDLMVAVRFAGGPESEDYIVRGQSLFSPEAQVLVRGTPGKYDEARALALQVFEALHLPSQSGYLTIKPEGAGPAYLGVDENHRHRFQVDVAAVYVAASTAGGFVPLPPTGALDYLLLRSPGGTLYRLSVSNLGALVVEPD
jgi:hypothetical protein